MLLRGLGHDRPNEIVGQNLGPKFFPDKFRRLTTQVVHLHHLLQRSQVEFCVPASSIEFGKVYFAGVSRIQKRCCKNENLRVEPASLDANTALADGQ